MNGRIRFVSAWLDQWDDLASDLPSHRVVFGFAVLAMLPYHPWVRDVPEGLLLPPDGLPALLPMAPGPWAVDALNAVLAIATAALIVGVAMRMAALAVGLALVILCSWAYAVGKVNHDILLVATPLVLLASAWTSRSSAEDHRARRGWPVGVLALTIALAMSTAAAAKAGSGWLDADTSATRFHILQNHIVTGREAPLTLWALGIEAPWLWEAADVGTVLLEFAFLPALISPATFRAVCAMAALFHVGVWATMDIAFAPNLIAYGAFAPWGRLRALTRWDRIAWHPSSRVRAGTALALGTVAAAVVLGGEPQLLRARPAIEVAIVVGGGILAAVFVAHAAVAWWAGFRRRRPSPAAAGEAILHFDGVCNLCNRWVDFLIRRDRAGRLRFTSLQSAWSRDRLGPPLAHDASTPPRSVVLTVGPTIYRESDAAIRSLAALGGAYRLALVLLVVPRVIRDECYRMVADHRYRIFGQRATCRVPTPEERARFIEDAAIA